MTSARRRRTDDEAADPWGRLVSEREGRKLDRAAARQRILDGEKQNEELSAELIRTSRKNDRG